MEMKERREFTCHCCCYPDCWNDEEYYSNNSREKDYDKNHNNNWCEDDTWKEDDCRNYENSREYENGYSRRNKNNSKCNCNNNNKDEDYEKKPTRRNRCCLCNLFRFHC